MTRAGHLVRRFAASLRPRALGAADLEFVRGALSPGEVACWERLGPADRAESLATARAALDALGPDAADPRWVAAALLHDVGKTETPLGPFRRSVATLAGLVVGPARVRKWSNWAGRYVNHDELGAVRLRAAGARGEAVAWAAAHHRPASWPATGIPPRICEILAAADGEPIRQ
jgi:putative nucleotidyltransferase with HDIG domain